MTRYVALLRAVNVGGTGKLAMSDLTAICREAGFVGVETYIASGNVVFEAKTATAKVRAELERRLLALTGKPIAVALRTDSEIATILAENPFPHAEPNRTYVVFLDDPPPPDSLRRATGVNGEQMRLGRREIYVHYPDGMGRSKLKIPAAKAGTARNLNTVAKLAAMASK
jgi:uncharacterized protein (DUF1697 family)